MKTKEHLEQEQKEGKFVLWWFAFIFIENI